MLVTALRYGNRAEQLLSYSEALAEEEVGQSPDIIPHDATATITVAVALEPSPASLPPPFVWAPDSEPADDIQACTHLSSEHQTTDDHTFEHPSEVNGKLADSRASALMVPLTAAGLSAQLECKLADVGSGEDGMTAAAALLLPPDLAVEARGMVGAVRAPAPWHQLHWENQMQLKLRAHTLRELLTLTSAALVPDTSAGAAAVGGGGVCRRQQSDLLQAYEHFVQHRSGYLHFRE